MNNEGLRIIFEMKQNHMEIGEKLYECLTTEEKNRYWTMLNGFEFQGYAFRDETKLKQNCKEVKS